MTIQFKKVNKRFDQKVIFDDLNLLIQEGERVLFQGPSGMGKTTLFNLFLGFEKVDSGEILFNGKLLDYSVIRDLRQKVAYVPQIIDLGQGLVGEVIEELMSFQANAGLTTWQEQLPLLLKQFLLGLDILNKKFPTLSGGEKQRIALIIAILLQRKIFILDEPTAALDTALKQKVIQYFSERKDTTLLIISHDMEWQQLDRIKTLNLAK